MSQQINPTKAGETPHDAFKAAEIEHAAKLAGERDARAQLEVATQALQDEGNAGARKALINAEQAMRFAEIEARGSSQRLEQARARLEQADHADRVAAHSRRAGAVSFMSFAAASREIAARRAELAARLAEVEADAAKVCQGFAQESASLTEQAQELGTKAPRPLDYSRVLDSFTARVRGDGAAAILAEVWKASVPAGMSADETLAAVERGVNPLEVTHLLADLGRAVHSQSVAAQKLVTIGYVPPSPNADRGTVPLVQFESCSASARHTRDKLQAAGFGAAVASIRVDALVSRLLAVPALGNVSGAQRVGELVARLRSADFLEVPGARNQHERQATRDAHAAQISSEMAALGFGDEARALRPPTPAVAAAVPTPGGPGFVNLGA